MIIFFSNKAMIGLDFSANFLKASGSIDTSGAPSIGAGEEIKSKVELKQIYDLCGRVGYNLYEKSLVYVKVGPTWGRWKGEARGESGVGRKGSASSTTMGFIVGVGVRMPVYPHMEIGLEYSHRHYKKMNYDVKDNANGTTLQNMVLKPTASSFELSFVYKI